MQSQGQGRSGYVQPSMEGMEGWGVGRDHLPPPRQQSPRRQDGMATGDSKACFENRKYIHVKKKTHKLKLFSKDTHISKSTFDKWIGGGRGREGVRSGMEHATN